MQLTGKKIEAVGKLPKGVPTDTAKFEINFAYLEHEGSVAKRGYNAR